MKGETISSKQARSLVQRDLHVTLDRPPWEQTGAAPRVLAIRRAAVRFASDHGPLAAARNGDEQAAHQVATNLVNILRREGLTISHITPADTTKAVNDWGY